MAQDDKEIKVDSLLNDLDTTVAGVLKTQKQLEKEMARTVARLKSIGQNGDTNAIEQAGAKAKEEAEKLAQRAGAKVETTAKAQTGGKVEAGAEKVAEQAGAKVEAGADKVAGKAGEKTAGKMDKFIKSTQEMGKAITDNGSFLSKFGSDVGKIMTVLTSSTSGYGLEILKTSRQAGVGVEEWQKLAYAADTTNVEQTHLMEGMNSLSKKLKEAFKGSALTGQAFQQLGINIKDTGGKLRTPNEIFKEISVVFAGMEDTPEKAALAVKLFGDSGTQLLPVLNLGKQGLEEMGEEANRSATFLSEEACKSCEVFDGSLGKLHIGLNSVVEKVADWIRENPELKSTIEEAVESVESFFIETGSLLKEVGTLATSFSDLVKGWNDVKKMVDTGIKAFKDLKDSIFNSEVVLKTYKRTSELAAGATKLFNQALKNNPIIRIISIIIALGTAVYFVIKHWDEVKAFFSKLWENVKEIFSKVWEWLKEMFMKYVPYELILQYWNKIGDWFRDTWDKVKAVFSATWEWLKEMFFNYTPYGLIIKHWDKITETFSNIWAKVKTAFSATWEWIKEMFFNYTPYGLIIKHWDKITETFSNIWAKVKTAFSATWEWIKEMFFNYTPYGLIIKHWDKITETFSDIWQKVKDVFSATWEWVKEMFLNYTPYGLIIKHWDEITAFFGELWESVKTLFTETWEQIASFFSGMNPVEWISGVWDKVGEFFSGLKDRFFDWGKEIIQGLVDGVTAFAKNAVESITNVGKNIAGKFKSLLGINSPSRLFMDYGLNITQGLTGGIHQGEEEVSRATQGLAESTTQKVKDALAETVQTQSGSNSYATEISNSIGGNSTEGGVSLVYSPTVNISGPVTEQSQQDFLKLLRSHKDEIIDLIERHSQNKTRLLFT